MSNFLLGGGDSNISANKLAPIGNLVGTSDTQTLTNKSLNNTTTFHIDNTDSSKKLGYQTSNATTNTTTILESKSTVNRTLSLPDITDSLVSKNSIDTLTNKTLINPTISSINNGGTVSFPFGNDTLLSKTSTDIVTNKSLNNSNCAFVDGTDNTKKMNFSSVAASTATTLTLVDQQTTSQSLYIPNLTSADTLTTTGANQTITGNKLFTAITGFISKNSTLYNMGNASQSGTTITGIGTTFSASMVGGLLLFATGEIAFISSFISTTLLTSYKNQTVASSTYSLYYGGTQVGSSGNIGCVNLNISSLTASSAVVTDANKNINSLAYSASSIASSLVRRDSNANTFNNNVVKNYTTTVTAAGTTTLTVSSSYYQYFTGTTTQTVILPEVSTLSLGFEFNVVNNSTSSIVIQSSGGNIVQTMTAGMYASYRCILTSGTTAASWSVITSSSASSVGGSNTQVQYNNAGVVAGASGLTIGSDFYPIVADKSAGVPTVPTSGTKLFSRFRTGRHMMGQISSSDTGYAFQPAFFSNKIGVWSALGNSTTVQTLNFGHTPTGSTATRNVTSDGLFGSMRRVGFSTASPPNSSAGTRHNAAQFFISSNPNYGGFLYVSRFGSSTSSGSNSTQRYFVGLAATVGVLSSSIEPSANTDIIGFSMDATDTAWQFICSNSSGPATKNNLGGTFPVRDNSTNSATSNNTNMFEARIFSPAGTNIVYYSLELLNNGTLYEGSTTINIPVVGTLLSPQIYTNNGTTGSPGSIDVVSQYIESDN